ncbi:hypothetical protein INR49_013304 [Caranx melampygus]|nr:hypothetical protein INR49_013304 [Caranx melampygus]
MPYCSCDRICSIFPDLSGNRLKPACRAVSADLIVLLFLDLSFTTSRERVEKLPLQTNNGRFLSSGLMPYPSGNAQPLSHVSELSVAIGDNLNVSVAQTFIKAVRGRMLKRRNHWRESELLGDVKKQIITLRQMMRNEALPIAREGERVCQTDRLSVAVSEYVRDNYVFEARQLKGEEEEVTKPRICSGDKKDEHLSPGLCGSAIIQYI